MEKVLGIGGFFFAATDKTALAKWYEVNLGLPQGPLSYEDLHWRQQGGSTLVEPIDFGSEEFGGKYKTWSINFRVADLDSMVAQLRAAGVEVIVDEKIYPNGRFASLKDPENNAIEIWQPMGAEADREEPV